MPLGFFGLSFTEFRPFFEASSLACAAGSWDRCLWLSLKAGFQWGLKELQEDTAWRVSEGCRTGPLGGSPVLNRVVRSKGERTGWVGRGEESEMKQRQEFFGEHVSCTAAVLVPAGDASGLNCGNSSPEGIMGGIQGWKADIM